MATPAREYSVGYVTPPEDAEALAAIIWRTSVAKFAAVLRNVVAEGNAGRLYVTDVESARDNPSGELAGRRQRSC